MGDAAMALLAGHGVFILGGSARAVHQRAVAFEQRCQHAWYARAAGGDGSSRVPQSFIDLVAKSDGEGFIGFWEAAVRAELAADPDLLGANRPGSSGHAELGFASAARRPLTPPRPSHRAAPGPSASSGMTSGSLTWVQSREAASS